MMRKGVCMPAIWFSPISVSSSHQPGFEAFISRVLNEPKIGSERENYKLSDYQINIVVERSKNLKSQEAAGENLKVILLSWG